MGSSQWNDRISFHRDPSTATCKVSSIQSFIYGGFSSRFWLMRKHINSMQPSELKDLPFYCWECITIQTDTRDIDLVIKNEKDMRYLLEFLIISLKTLDGYRDTAAKYLLSTKDIKCGSQKRPSSPSRFFKSKQECEHAKQIREVVTEDASREEEQRLYLRVFKKFTILRVRMKISFMALKKMVPVQELLLESILATHKAYCAQGNEVRQYQRVDSQVYSQLLQGQIDLKVLCWSKIEAEAAEMAASGEQHCGED